MIFSSDVSGFLFWTKADLVNADRLADAGAVTVWVSLASSSCSLGLCPFTWPAAAAAQSPFQTLNAPKYVREKIGHICPPVYRCPLCDVHRLAAADRPGGMWSVAAFLNFTACVISRQPKSAVFSKTDNISDWNFNSPCSKISTLNSESCSVYLIHQRINKNLH